jgi:hypothetical protein
MKRPFVFAVLTLACIVQAQQTPEQRIVTGLAKLRDEQQLYLFIEGSETINGVTNRYKTHLYWQTDAATGKPTTKFQLLQVHDNAPGGPLLVQRIVGNGETVWNYDHRAKEYSATQYGGYGAARPQNYAKDLLQSVNSSAKGQAVWATKLLREIHADSNVSYKSWMPGVQPYELWDGPTPDPVWNERVYMGTPAIDYVMYDGSPRRTIVFELQDDPPSDDYRLSAIYFTERSKVGRSDRLVEWKMTPFKGIAFDEKNFAPYTYNETRGWKPLVSSSPIKN